MTDVSISVPAKRRRGRPRKDAQGVNNTTTPRAGTTLYLTPDTLKNNKKSKPDGIVGSMVYGVIEGSFDAGYLISVRIGNSDTPFRGVVFQPKKFVPVTTDNDVAPQAKMYQRREINVPYSPIVSGPRPQTASKQTVLRPVLPYNANQSAMMTRTGSPPVHPTDEATQAYGKLAEPGFGPGSTVELGHQNSTKDMTGPAFGSIQRGETNDMFYYNEFYRQGDIAAESVPKSLNLKLDLQTNYFIDNEPKSPAANNNLGYHHALVSGNPLLLPPEFSIGEPLDFMMGKNCKARQETSNEVVGSPSGPYKLELATPRSTTVNEQTNNGSSSGCITDMDFVLSDVVQGNVCL